MKPTNLRSLFFLSGAVVIGTVCYIVAADNGLDRAQEPKQVLVHLTQEQKQILNHFSLVDLPDGQGGFVEAIRISGINVQIVNGLGSTNTINGVGNLIVGYQELGNPNVDDRTGSHNIVGGSQNSYSSYGGLVAGWQNTVSGLYSSVSGGSSNIASGDYASVSGGSSSTAGGFVSSVSGGELNEASGDYSSVSGGGTNTASGEASSIIGGSLNVASGNHSSASNFLSVSVLEIRGGADIVEGFETTGNAAVEAGTVMVVDPANPGLLMTSTKAYDLKVAGVVSGAGGVEPGILLGQRGVLDGDTKVAMTGRVYVKCSAENGAVRPGDRLTTASLAGHAMKATDASRSDGAVIGKAMSSLDEGAGLVLVLVNLQ